MLKMREITALFVLAFSSYTDIKEKNIYVLPLVLGAALVNIFEFIEKAVPAYKSTYTALSDADGLYIFGNALRAAFEDMMCTEDFLALIFILPIMISAAAPVFCDGMGAGDICLMMFLCLTLGCRCSLLITCGAVLTCGITCSLFFMLRLLGKREEIAFAPFFLFSFLAEAGYGIFL